MITVLYAISVFVWPLLWRKNLFWLGGIRSNLIFWENRGIYLRLTIPEIHTQIKQRNIRMSLSEKVLTLVALCLGIYGFVGFL